MTNDMGKYQEAYLSEARSHLKEMNMALIHWEKHPNHKKSLQDIFRIAHTLKSMSASMGYEQIAQLSHAVEDLLAAIKNKEVSLKDCVDLLFNCFDFLEQALQDISKNQPEPDLQGLVQDIRGILAHQQTPYKPTPSSEPSSKAEPLSTIEVKVERLDKLLNLTKELLVNKMRLETLSELIQSSDLSTTIDIMNRVLMELQYHVMQIRLVPIGFVFDRFIRMVRDMAKHQNKEVNLRTEGRDIELDRSLIDPISETLAHLIKNAIDHGLEKPKERAKLKKSPEGTLQLSARRERESLVIELIDDGQGLNLEAIKSQLVKRNLVSESASKKELMNSIFNGVSTSAKVTAVSGRGLGLAIVKQKIESVNGTITVDTEKGKGTKFTLKIPITLAVIFVLLVRQGDQTYAIPLNSIERLITLPRNDIKGVLNQENIIYNESTIPVIYLSKLFNVKQSLPPERLSLIVLHKENQHLGLIVDVLLTTEEIITQPINTVVKGIRMFSGTALLGSGETILILDIDQLFAIKHDKLKRITHHED